MPRLLWIDESPQGDLRLRVQGIGRDLALADFRRPHIEMVAAATALEGLVEEQDIDVVCLTRIIGERHLHRVGALVASSNRPLVVVGSFLEEFTDEQGTALREEILPRTEVLIGRAEDAARLVGHPLVDDVDMRRVARTIAHQGVSSLLLLSSPGYGGRSLGWCDMESRWFEPSDRLMVPSTLAQAVATLMVQGQDCEQRLRTAYQWALTVSDDEFVNP